VDNTLAAVHLRALLTISLQALQESQPSSTSYGGECSSSENSCGVSHCSCAAQLRTLLLKPSLLGLLLSVPGVLPLALLLLLLLRRLPASLLLGRGLLPAACGAAVSRRSHS
jgi:hypothetical protein